MEKKKFKHQIKCGNVHKNFVDFITKMLSKFDSDFGSKLLIEKGLVFIVKNESKHRRFSTSFDFTYPMIFTR